MKTLIPFIIILFIAASSISPQLSSQNSKNKVKKTKETVKVYYFHFTRRCETCLAVESETKSILKELYPSKNGTVDVKFESVDLDTKKGQKIGKKLNISEQTLLIVKGKKRIDLTAKAFMYATSKPDKLRDEIEKAVKTL